MTTPSRRLQPANPRASLAALFSFILPGLGQAYNGQAGLAWILATPVLLLILVGGGALLFSGSTLIARMVDTRFLVGLIVLDVALLAWRLLAIVQAHGRRELPSWRHWTTYLTAVVVVLTLGMHLLPAYYAAKAIDTLGAVSAGGGGTTGQGHIPGFTPLPVPSEQPDVKSGERVNVLLVGVDALPTRGTQLTDTMLVVSLDPRGRHSAMISIPRDTYGVPLPNGQPFNQKLNALMAVANNNPSLYPHGGVTTLKETVGNLLGIKIHYFAAINLLGFKQAVDSVGGVDVDVERAITDPTYSDETGTRTGFYLDAGMHHLDGHTALGYVRSRKGIGDSDFTRAERQQRLLTAMRAKLTAGNLVTALPGLLDAVKETITTDVPSDKLPELAQAIQDADTSHLQRIVLQPPKYFAVSTGTPAGYILIPDFDAIRAVGERLAGNRPDSTDGAANATSEATAAP